ncbi:MAG: hypothetical protein VKS61_10040 [Candidatus Sericytochromatia bacterium]|nr:hypothetical protein [Candidatus Sericytochromatia bacterium]
MRDDELRSLVLGVVLIGLLMAGSVWAFMRWGTPPDDPYDKRHRAPGGGHGQVSAPHGAGHGDPPAAPHGAGHGDAPAPPHGAGHGDHHAAPHGAGHDGAATPAAGSPAPSAAGGGWPVKPRRPRPHPPHAGH